MTAAERVVDRAIDTYLARMRRRGGVEPMGVRRTTLAAAARVTPREMSEYLQTYRHLQGRKNTRYVIAATGYGRAGRWRILDAPGRDARSRQDLRRVQTIWIAEDAARRFVADVAREVRPGLRQSEIDETIRQVLPLAEGTLGQIVLHVERVLANGT